ncbi:hypothetical protein GPALN_006491 [Globodera pallida]|nr:hypothetical protein GPALN_006491 [Globodera pallida]
MRTMKWMMYWKRPLKANRRRKQKSEEAATDEPENEAVDAATNEPENENVHERGREWKDVHTGIKLRSLARENSPFARDIEFVPILKRLQFQNEDITLETILALHKAVMETDGQNEAAGQIRTCNVRVGRFNPMDHTRVPAAMSIFIEWLRVQMAAGQMSAGELSARAQCRLVSAHPSVSRRGGTHVQASHEPDLDAPPFQPSGRP